MATVARASPSVAGQDLISRAGDQHSLKKRSPRERKQDAAEAAGEHLRLLRQRRGPALDRCAAVKTNARWLRARKAVHTGVRCGPRTALGVSKRALGAPESGEKRGCVFNGLLLQSGKRVVAEVKGAVLCGLSVQVREEEGEAVFSTGRLMLSLFFRGPSRCSSSRSR